MTARERARRPVASKLRPSRQVSWQELQDDHTVKWQSPSRQKNPETQQPCGVRGGKTSSDQDESATTESSLHVILPRVPLTHRVSRHRCTSSHHNHRRLAEPRSEKTLNNRSLHRRPITHQLLVTPKARWVFRSSRRAATRWSGCRGKHLVVRVALMWRKKQNSLGRRSLTYAAEFRKTTRRLQGQAIISRAIEDAAAIEISLFRSASPPRSNSL